MPDWIIHQVFYILAISDDHDHNVTSILKRNGNMKLSKKTARLALEKAVSIILIAGIAVSLTACPAGTTGSTGQADDRITVTTRTTEPNRTIDPVQTTAESAAAAPTGAYNYVLYEGTPQQTTICMDYDIHPGTQYLQQHNYPTAYYYEIDTLASSLGWKLNGAFSIEETTEDTDPTYFYTYDYGDYLALLEVEESTDIVFSGAWVQIEALRISYVKKDDLDTPYFEDQDPNHKDIIIAFGNHQSAIEYPGLGTHWAFSYNDYVLITYLFWLLPQLGEAKTAIVYNTLLPAAVSITTDEDDATPTLNLQ